MSDIFISYARSTEAQARQIAEALRALGYSVWRDDELPAHRAYAEVIEERLKTAKVVVVVWSAEAVKSQWVFSEANRAREDGKLVQLTLDTAPLPMPFDTIQCANLIGWAGDVQARGWRKVVTSVGDLAAAMTDVASPLA
ncbi:MAG: toll/interleukin-1 receptor domain-containing protein, partial [Caulobacteraceae bacterium]